MLKPQPKSQNIIDRLVEYVAPGVALRRQLAREILQSQRGQYHGTGYDAGRLNSRTDAWNPSPETGDTWAWDHIIRLRARGWDLYRNDGMVRKIINATIGTVIGRGHIPESEAIDSNGMPIEEFRQTASKLWKDLQPHISGYGSLGAGGLHGLEMAKLALREVMLSGECLIQFVPLSKREQNRRQAPIPLAINLCAAERMVEYDWYAPIEDVAPGNFVFRGIEFREDGSRAAYWMYDVPPADPRWWTNKFTAKRYPAENFIHLYFQDRIGQMRGVPWLAPVLMMVRDLRDLQQNELLASALRSCVAMAIKRLDPGSKFGASSFQCSTDSAGNTRTHLQPGSLLHLNPEEELMGNASGGPNVNVGDFAGFIQRGIAGGIPGMKSSTLTGDYRNSSFSSERSSENDNWRETEQVQDWFDNHFYQPIYNQVIDTALVSGYMPMPADYLLDPYNYQKAKWSVPVRRDLNPQNEVDADAAKVKSGLASFQSVTASRGENWRDVLRARKEVEAFAEQIGLSDEAVDQIYSVPLAPEVQTPDEEADENQGTNPQNFVILADDDDDEDQD